MWFWRAADAFVKEYDVPNDHDGPRHFDMGFGFMVVRVIKRYAERHGTDRARGVALRVQSAVEQWLADNPAKK